MPPRFQDIGRASEPRLRVDLGDETGTVNLDPPKYGVVPSGVFLVAALLPVETHTRQLVLGIACRVRQKVFIRLVQREVLQRIESGLWRGLGVEQELVRRERVPRTGCAS